ncbi:hypothetical protein [Peribacillus acanthi]|uniref:hypothetical protein n=1 Tax=Peribacillus acanthi TaxID=2171554 RepID=UPI000D3ED79C|nr:hypothetical protein [Peribacillus acanthi]
MTTINNLEIMASLQKAQENKSTIAQSVPQQKYKAKLLPGNYIAVLTNAVYEKNQPSKFGINNRVKATYEVINNGETHELIVQYWESPADSSLYTRHLSILLGRDSRDGFTLNELIGSVVEIEVVHNETEKGVYANIENITPVDIKEFQTGMTI